MNSILSDTATFPQMIACILAAIVYGAVFSAAHSWKSRSSRSFLSALVILPAAVAAVILLVNGNLGTGVAVAGAFSLVRFRSAQGNAGEITSIFLVMAIGLACGMGYLGIGLALTLIFAVMEILLSSFPERHGLQAERTLKILIPENLNYNGVFDDIFGKYTEKSELLKVRTVEMGSLYQLNYLVTLKNEEEEKEMIDELRVRNGNLEIVCGRTDDREEAL